jgi:hypothetical protein
VALFVPEWTRVPASLVRVKDVLRELDDDVVVRRPMRPIAGRVDCFVRHRDKGWMAMAVETTPFTALDPAQLFESDATTAFVQRLEALQQLGQATQDTSAAAAREPSWRPVQGIPVLVVMWSCTSAEVGALRRNLDATDGLRLASKDQFLQLGARLIDGMLAPLAPDAEHDLLGAAFPETEIAPACTVRRTFRRDNRATLERLFLDLDQEAATKLDLDLPGDEAALARDMSVRLVNGVAGSGKTLIALHRALLLAELFPTQRVLLLIHNTPIVADLKERLRRAGRAVPRNLEISTFFRWATGQWRIAFGRRPEMPAHGHLPALIRERRGDAGELDGLDDPQLVDELDFVNEHSIADEAAYVDADRTGRGFALDARRRRRVWALYVDVSERLRESGLRPWSAVPRELIAADPSTLARLAKVHHVLVDEAQFFAPSWFALVKAALEPGGSLFLCADPNQGFMRNRLSWKRVGLDVAGRTRKLRRSYRTTHAILDAANRVLETLGRPDGDDFLEPDFRGMDAGVAPRVIYTDSPQDSLDRLANEIERVTRSGRVPLHALLVVYGDNVDKAALYRALGRRLGVERVWWFNKDDQKHDPPQAPVRTRPTLPADADRATRDNPDPDGPGDHLRMAYLDTATGLEASVVFLLGMERVLRGGVGTGRDDAGAESPMQSSSREPSVRKLYMAMTRAGLRLVLLSTQRLPPRIEALFETQDVAHRSSRE